MNTFELHKLIGVMNNLPTIFPKSDYEKVARQDHRYYVTIDRLVDEGYIVKCGEEEITVEVEQSIAEFEDGYKMPKSRLISDFSSAERNILIKAHGNFSYDFQKAPMKVKRYLYTLNKPHVISLAQNLLTLAAANS